MDRRDFLRRTALTGGILATSGPAWWRDRAHGRPRRADLVLRGGFVYDGTGRPPVRADVGVQRDRITDVGVDLPTRGIQVLDVEGLAVAPGFIDIHSHADLVLLVNPRAESMIRQGVTTVVVGQDGGSIGPWTDERLAETRQSYRTRYDVEIDFRDLAGFFARLERDPPSVNLASMVGAGTIRSAVVGNDDRPASDREIERMVAHVHDAIAAGACGLSTGLEYIPGAFADLNELVALARPLRATGLPFASHMRNEDDQLLASIEEALNVGRLAGVPVQIAHLKAQGSRNWWKAAPALELLERARADGIDVMFDRYPYVAYSTGLSSLFPVWARDGGTTAFLRRLGDAQHQARIERAVRAKIEKLGSWDAVQVTSTGSGSLIWARGRRLGQLASERGEDPYRLLVHLIREDRSRAGMVGFGMSEDNTSRFLEHPLGMVCSDGSALATDGPLATGTPHPRSYGTFPRVLGHYCRDNHLMPLETAVHKMSGMPAARLRLPDRGTIAPGTFADLVVFDPDTVQDRATFEAPHQYADGISHVLVNGTMVIEDGEHTGARPGQPVGRSGEGRGAGS